MLEREKTLAISAVIEEELGSFRLLADLPATELEAMAARIARAVAPYAVLRAVQPESRAA